MRNVLVAVSVLLVAAATAGAQPPAGGDSNPVKLTRVPDTVTPVETAVPDNLLSEGARDVRTAFGPGKERLADGFHQSLEQAGFDVAGGVVTAGKNGDVTFTSGASVEGPVTVTATVGAGGSLTLVKVWAPPGPGLQPIRFTQPPKPAAEPQLKPLVNANGEPIVLPQFPPDFPRTPGASILTPFDAGAPFDPNAPVAPFTPPPGWTPVPGNPNIYVPPPPTTTGAVQPVPGGGIEVKPLPLKLENTTIGSNTGGTPQGGAISNTPAAPSIQNSTIGGNTAGGGGGAIVNPGTLQLQNSTINSNTPGNTPTGKTPIGDTPIGRTDTSGFKAAVNVTDTGFISGFTLIEGGCDFLDDGSPSGGDRCSGNTPLQDPNWSWPNVMVQVLDQNGFRFVENPTNPLVRDEARIEKVHIFGGGGPELLGRGSDDVIEDFEPATYDNSVQYELISVRVEIRTAVRNGFNLLRDWLLRRPQEILAARSERAAFMEQARSAPSRSAPPSRSRARSALSLLLTSTGTSTGEAFRVQALANSPITFDLTSVVAEPLKGVKPNAIAKASTMFGARGAQSATAIGYCLEFTRQPPSAGMLYRIAGPEIQKRFEPMRRVGNAARKLSEAGELKPDSDPKSYAHSIAQWAIWSSEQKFTQSSYTQAFVDHTRKAVEAAGRPWQREYAQQVEKAAPNRWQQIQRILRVAGM